MENLRYIAQLRWGIPIIIKSMKNFGAREPKLKETGEEFASLLCNVFIRTFPRVLFYQYAHNKPKGINYII